MGKTAKPHDSERTFELAQETLTGDIRDAVLSEFKNPGAKAWEKLGEHEQQRLIDRAASVAEHLVLRTVEIVAAQGRRTVRASLKKVTITDGIKAEIELSKFDDQRHELIDATGASVLIVLADASEFRGERAAVKPDKDEPEMFKSTEQIYPEQPRARGRRGSNGAQPAA